MSEDRTQAPTKRRRQQAKERGQVARSPELTAAVGLLAAVALLGAFGGDLVAALVAAVRSPWTESADLATDPAGVAWAVRRAVLGIAAPLGAVVVGVLVAAVAAHQAQVGGLWAPGLLAPDPSRFLGGIGGSWGSRAARGAWGLVKAGVIAAVAAWAIRSRWEMLGQLGRMDAPALAKAVGALLRSLAFALGAASLVLGLLDYAWQRARLEALLRTTPEEQREDQRAVEGDPALRARRQRAAKSRRVDPGEALAGAALVLTGGPGLAIVLGGGREPRRASVRMVAKGPLALRLRQLAQEAAVPKVNAPALARLLARSGARTLPPHLAAELAAHWPKG